MRALQVEAAIRLILAVVLAVLCKPAAGLQLLDLEYAREEHPQRLLWHRGYEMAR